ncbi:MAG: chemotaxis response regulator protein-glutamate methylesterase [Pseudomonadota bacterium]
MSIIKVVVVDDSPTMRGIIAACLNRQDDIKVVGTAGDPYEARAAIKELNPDVVTLDVEMPRMDGLSFLEKIMRLRPMPVIMISTLTEKGAAVTLEALRIGAFDCLCKPQDGDAMRAFAELPDLVRAAGKARIRSTAEKAPQAPPPADFRPNKNILTIGSSTGGVDALATILASFPKHCPPTVITQHMPPSFTKSFADRLNQTCAPQIEEATQGAPLMPGHIYLAPGGEAHLRITSSGPPACDLYQADRVSGHRPSVDVLFSSVSERFGRRAVGVLLTGMGKDGARGLKLLRDNGGKTLGQDEATSVVYGMPRVAYEIGAVERQLPLEAIADAALDLCRDTSGSEAA